MRRAAIVLNHFAQPPSSPGGTRHVELFSSLEGWDARVIAADRNLIDGSRVRGAGILETVRVTPYSSNGPARILNWASYSVTAFARALPARRVDLVYGSSPHLLGALCAWLVALLRRVPFVLEVRDVWPKVLVEMGALDQSSRSYLWLRRLERFLYRRADRIVILADGVRDHLVRNGVQAGVIVFVPNGADPGDFAATAPRSKLRARYGFDGVVAVYAGAHGPANGLDLVIDAAAELASKCPELTIVLVGDGAEKDHLVDRVKREDLPNVRFMDPVPKSEIRDLFAGADIGLHCLADVELFRHGVSPNKLYDYMAAGLPVVTNTPGEVSRFVEESGAGVAVAPNGLAAGLRQLVGLGEAQRQQLGSRGRDHMEETRSRVVRCRLLEATLDSLVPLQFAASSSQAVRPK